MLQKKDSKMKNALLFKSFSKLGRDFFNLAKRWPTVTLPLKKKSKQHWESLFRL